MRYEIRTQYPADFEKHCAWYAKNLKIVDKRSRVVPMALYDHQKALEWEVYTASQERRACRLVVLKARQEGVSSWVAARFYRDIKENTNRSTLIMNYDEKATRRILEKVRFFYDTDDRHLDTEKDSEAALKFVNGSEFFIYTAGAEARAARSFTSQGIHFSELDYYTDPDVFTSAMQIAVDDYPTLIVVESTSKGPDGPMQRLWDRSIEGRSGFKPIFFPWYIFPEYTKPITYADLLQYGPRDYTQTRLGLLKPYVAEEAERALGEKSGLNALQSSSGSAAGLDPPPAGGEATPQGPAKGRGGRAKRSAGALEEPGPRGGRRTEDRALQPGSDLGPGGDPGLEALPPGMHGERSATRKGSFGHYLRYDGDHLRQCFEDSLTDYEKSILVGHDLTFDQLNWLRMILEINCEGRQGKRFLEYPTSPDEAFTTAEEAVLDPLVIARWEKEAKDQKVRLIRFRELHFRKDGTPLVMAREDNLGKVSIYKEPEDGVSYCLGCDPASGLEEGDFSVACVVRTDTGEQVAELRAKMDPDRCIDQVERLALYYNRAYTGIEVNSVGLGWARVIEDRGLLPMYEREQLDHIEPGKRTKLIGWITSAKTKDDLFNEMRARVREGQCQLRSLATIQECKTLVVTRTVTRRETIAARSGSHDDGVMAYGIALQMRVREMPLMPVEKEVERKPEEDPREVLVASMTKVLSTPTRRLPLHLTAVRHKHAEILRLIDGRRI